MQRFYLPPSQCDPGALMLAGREAHHALHVLRIRRGETVAVLDGAGREFTCRVENFDRDKVQLVITGTKTEPQPAARITLLQAIPKGKIIESIIQKATELGASRIVPLLTERVATQLDAKGRQQKAEKLAQVAVEAIKQCGSPWLPKIEPPATPDEFLARGERFDLPLIASLRPGARHAREYFREFHDRHRRAPASVCIWIGPEGDFTPDEVSAALTSGAEPITLGKLVLRVETAAIYCLSVINHELSSPQVGSATKL